MNREIIKAIATDFWQSNIKLNDEVSLGQSFDEWWIENEKKYVTRELESSDNILEHANKIIFNRGEEKDRKYGPFSESMSRAAKMASLLIIDKDITTEDMFKCLIALKTSRMAYNHKYDTMLDAIGYIAGLNDYLENK